VSAKYSGAKAARGNAPGHGSGLSELSVSVVPQYRSSHGRAVGAHGYWIGSSDREVDHGEKVQSEEEIQQEKEGRSGQQKEENTEGVGEEEDGKKSNEAGEKGGQKSRQQAGGEGGSEAESRAEAQSRTYGACSRDARTGARAVMDSALQYGRRQQRWQLARFRFAERVACARHDCRAALHRLGEPNSIGLKLLLT
jgi:hypothetical protein